uniref:Small ribosomal subunit protein uS2c n=1 Tax=Caulerpa cliftonii TaxID=1004391 RepID=A0A1C9JBT9_9CHLO|nr:ribosomal protein S2 [Caulerpa cliftonii]AOP19304.1 ribosomal protein S2 [Caulerpa cliftonii]
MFMTIQLQEMFNAGVHLGHHRRQGNPKMQPYIYREKDNYQIIDLLQTHWYLKIACQFLFDAYSKGNIERVLFVGTKKYIGKCIEKTAKNCECWYINKRWLGGFLTNWTTMQKSIFKLNQKALRDKKNLRLLRQQKRLEKYLGGVQTMKKPPDLVIIVGQQKEINAVRECQKLKIPNITILDTNCDPSLTDLLIPANDDSLSSVNYILTKLAIAIQEGQKDYKRKKKIEMAQKRFQWRRQQHKSFEKKDKDYKRKKRPKQWRRQ